MYCSNRQVDFRIEWRPSDEVNSSAVLGRYGDRVDFIRMPRRAF